MSKHVPRATGVLGCLVLAVGVLAMGSNATAHQVPNEENWHIHDRTGAGPLAGDHHAPLGFWPQLFAQEDSSTGLRRRRSCGVPTQPTSRCCPTARTAR
jgi:hypothetical protein